MGLSAGLAALVVLAMPGQQRLHASGPANTGHQDLACESCHRPAPGSRRQQIQANVAYWLGRRETGADYGHQAVDNQACLACHERPNDRHPVFRFLEPRFAEARQALAPHQCASCHLEHQGGRVTLAVEQSGYCVNCHQEISLKNDPASVPHARLIAEERWQSCLGCHDYHGNHQMETETDLRRAFDPQAIEMYFQGGPSPYSDTRYHQAKREVVDG